MRNNKLKQLRTFGQAKQIAAEEIQRYKEELFIKNASEILQQVMAARKPIEPTTLLSGRIVSRKGDDFCPRCGQAILWEDKN